MFNSKSLRCGVLLAVLKTVFAQTAPGFPVQASSETLEITFGTNVVEPAGEQLPRSDLLSAPEISAPDITLEGQGILLMVDSDVPRNGTRVELLHWLVSNVTLSQDDSTLIIPTTGEAAYRPPNPPIGDVPHAYTFILFEQPDEFSIPEEFNDVLETRIFFNTTAFVAAAGLSQPALAANYIRVQNLTGTPTTTFPPPRATNGTTNNNTPSSTPEQFPGAAPGGLASEGYFWAGLGTAIAAGVAAIAL